MKDSRWTEDELDSIEDKEFILKCTPEELDREITEDRFRVYHMEVGEDFIDQNDHKIDHEPLLAIMKENLTLDLFHKLKGILYEDEGNYACAQVILEFYELNFSKEEWNAGSDRFYREFAEAANKIPALKSIVNAELLRAKLTFSYEDYE